MHAWIGKAFVFIGIVHSIFGFVIFRSTIADFIGDGILNSVSGRPDREVAFWFLFFGFLGIITGILTDWCERTFGLLPDFLGWALFAFAAAFVIIMPKSGAWMVFIPAIGAIWRSLDGKLFS